MIWSTRTMKPGRWMGWGGEEEPHHQRLAAEDLLQRRLGADQQADGGRHPGGSGGAPDRPARQPFENEAAEHARRGSA